MKESNKKRGRMIKNSAVRIVEATLSGVIAGIILELLK